MKVDQFLKELFSLRLPTISLENLGILPTPTNHCGSHPPSSEVEADLRNRYNRAKIKFDNSVRFFASTVMVAVAFVIYWFGEPIKVAPLISAYLGYGTVLISLTFLINRLTNTRFLDFVVCSVDVFAISISIYYSGGLSSPFFFVYFLPLLIQSYHRDWGLILLYGFGSLGLYTLVSLASPNFAAPGQNLQLITRLILMSAVVCIAVIAVRLLRQKEGRENRRLSKMRALNQISGRLNGLSRSIEITGVVRELVGCLNREVGPERESWAQIFLVQEAGDVMRAVMDPANVRFDTKQEVPTKACRALAENRVIKFDDVHMAGGCPVEKFSFRSQICAPIFGNFNEPHGVIFMGSSKTAAFDEEDREFLEFLGRSLGVTIQRLRAMDEMRQAVEMSSCVAAAFLSSTRSLKDTFSSLLDGIMSLLKAEQSSLMLWDKDLGKMVVRDARGPYANCEHHLTAQVGEGLPGKVFEAGKPLWTSDIAADEKYGSEKMPFKSLLCIPLINLKGEPMGVVNAWSNSPIRTVSPYEIDIAMTFVAHAAIAIENARQRDKNDGNGGEHAAHEGKAA